MEQRTVRSVLASKWQQLLGKAVRDARTRRGMTQAELGAPMLTKGFISQVEKGVSALSIDSLLHIADKLGMAPAQLLAWGDPEYVLMTTLDMAEAALMLHGQDAGDEWIALLPALMDEKASAVSVVVEKSIATSKLAAGRFLRYRGLATLKGGNADTALELLEPAPAMVTRADERATRFWLGEAYRRAGRLREAMRTWEQLLKGEPGPVLRAVTLQHLSTLYETMGDVVEAQRLRDRLPSSLTTDDVQYLPHNNDGHPQWLWMVACDAFDRGDLATAAAYARPIPLHLANT